MIDLERMRYLMHRIPRAYWRIEQAFDRATKVTPTLSDMPHASGVSSKVEDGAIEIAAARQIYNQFVDQLYGLQVELLPKIHQLNDPMERTAVYLRYIEKMKIDDIAIAIERCDRQTKRIIERAQTKIKKMEDISDE